MPQTCPHCQESFNQWLLYKIHLETSHSRKEVKPGVAKPLSPLEKAAIVARGEARMGKEHFYGKS